MTALAATIEFESHGTRCEAWYLEATTDALTSSWGRPCIVMGHGFGATRDAGLMPFAQRFAALGADVLIFDYRGFGGSDGSPRQLVSWRRHRQDYHAAIAAARSRDGVDGTRVALWGSSYSGGHVVAVAAQDRRIAAVVSQGAAMDGLAAMIEIARYAGVGQLLRLTRHGFRDLLGSVAGRDPHLIEIVAAPGSLAAITAPGAVDGYQSIMGPTFRNEMAARTLLFIGLNRPVRFASKVRCPALFVLAERDNIAPPDAVRRAASAAPRAELLELPSSHFDIYTGEMFEQSVAVQAEFFSRVLAGD